MELTIKKIQRASKIYKLLDEVCEKYFEAHASSWKYYGGWELSNNNHNYIVIHSGYYDYKDQYGSDDEIIPMDVLIEFSKTLNKQSYV